jgi:NTE family protein
MTKTAAAATDAVRDLALVFSGGVGLGGYQGGVYAYLHQQPRLRPSWIAGSSIGAVNAALIAGNPPADRIDRLRMFWMNAAPVPTYRTGRLRHWQNWTSVLQGRLFGIPGHFHPRWLAPASGFKSFYSLRPMQARICELVDFGRLNSGEIA